MNPDPLRYRTFWRRFWAIWLDVAALAPLGWIDQWIWNTTTSRELLAGWTIMECLICQGYHIGLVAVCGQTLGRMAMGVRILASDETPATFLNALMRHSVGAIICLYFMINALVNIQHGELGCRGATTGDLFLFMGVLLLLNLWTILELITMLTNDKRRAIHDFIGRTVVVRDDASRDIALRWLLISLWVINFFFNLLVPDPNMADRKKQDERVEQVIRRWSASHAQK